MLVDVGHMNLRLHSEGYFHGITPGEYFARIPVPILEVHLHDNKGDDDRHGHIGFGDVDFTAVARGLRATGFDGISTIEICPLFHGSKPPESRPRVRESLDTWRKLWIQAGLDHGSVNRDAAGGVQGAVQ